MNKGDMTYTIDVSGERVVNELTTIAEKNKMEILEVVKTFISLGFTVSRIESNQDEKIIIRDEKTGEERELVLFDSRE